MKIFLTGGTGFIGSHFLRMPYASEHEIISYKRSGFSNPCLKLQIEPTWLIKPLDEVTAEDMAGCEALVHLASPGVSPKKAEWAELFYWNVTATLRLVEQAKLAGVRRIVVAGTFAEYGRSADRYDLIPVIAPLEPTTGYAASKAAACIALSAYAIEHKLELAYLRIFSAFGEGQYNQSFWPALKQAALNGENFAMTPGEQIRDYISVDNVAASLWQAAVSQTIIPGSPFITNVGSGEPVTMRAFAEKWWAHFSAKGTLQIGALPYRANEVMRFVPEVTPL